MKVWIDLSNSPHPLLFAPIARRLKGDGHDVLITARDNAQTVALAQRRWPGVEVIGSSSPKGKTAKLAAIGRRIAELRSWAAGSRPDVALSHNSYAQIAAARALRIPAVTAMDFEHQPANHLAFRLADRVLVPEILPLRSLQLQGGTPRKVVRYPGLKEELYIGDFEPDNRILATLGIKQRPRTVVAARTPPTRALYHGFANPLFEEALMTVCSQENLVCIALARHPEQLAAMEALDLPNCIIPRAAIDSRSLIYVSDAMIGGGGTMTREAALMGIPTWTLFAGTPPAVDLCLEAGRMLRRLKHADQLRSLGPRSVQPFSPAALRERGRAIEDVFVSVTVSTAARGAARPVFVSA
jgi:predicted glycosyltransferase